MSSPVTPNVEKIVLGFVIDSNENVASAFSRGSSAMSGRLAKNAVVGNTPIARKLSGASKSSENTPGTSITPNVISILRLLGRQNRASAMPKPSTASAAITLSSMGAFGKLCLPFGSPCTLNMSKCLTLCCKMAFAKSGSALFLGLNNETWLVRPNT